MISADDVEAFIQHYFDQVYDPVKAHQYYEDHKKLKGRQPAQSDTSSGKRYSKAAVTNAPPKETAEQKKAKLDAEVAALKARLEQLRAILRELVAEAKKRSGIEVNSEGETASGSSPKSDSNLTPQEKEEAAKKAHDYYEKTKGTLPSQETTHVLKQKIALIEKKIAEMRAKLASALNTIQIDERKPSPSGPEQRTQVVKKGDSQNGS